MDEVITHPVDLISPYGDFDSSDLASFWASSLGSVTVANIDSVVIEGGYRLKITGDSSTGSVHSYIKTISITNGKKYFIEGVTTFEDATPLILGGSTSGGNEYFSILSASISEGWSKSFTATGSSLYLAFVHAEDIPSEFLTVDNIILYEGWTPTVFSEVTVPSTVFSEVTAPSVP